MNLIHILACHIHFSCANLSIQDRGIRPYYIPRRIVYQPQNQGSGIPLGRNPNHLLEITMAAPELGTPLPISRTPHHTITSSAGIQTSINISRIPNHTPKSSSRPHTLVSYSRKTLSLFVFSFCHRFG
jgi:hypothetical protein